MNDSTQPSFVSSTPPPIIARKPDFDDQGFVTTGEHLHCPFRCTIKFEFIDALIVHLGRHHTKDRHRKAGNNMLVCRWLDCAFNVSVRDEERFISHLKRHLEVSHLGAFAFINSRLPHTPPRSSLSTTSGERGQYSDSLFGSTHNPSPAALQAGHNEEFSNNHPTPVRLSGSEWDETESSENLDGEVEDRKRSNDEPAGLSVADSHNDEDDEAEADGVTKSESRDDKALSRSSRATTLHLNFPTSSPDPTPVLTLASTATPAPAPILDHANATPPPKRVQYKHKISHFTGRFKHLVDLDDNEPIPKFEYSLHQKGRLKTHVKVVPMERKHSDKDRGDESENENELE